VNAYEAGFARGEAESFVDRAKGLTRAMPIIPKGEYQRGFCEGYTPRSALWAGRPVDDKRRLWWQDKEEE